MSMTDSRDIAPVSLGPQTARERLNKLVTQAVKDGLKLKQIRFAQNYVADLDHVEAARSVGVRQAGWGLKQLKNPVVAQLIADLVTDQPGSTRLRVLDELAAISFSNIDNYIQRQPDGSAYIDINKATPDQMRAVSEIICDTYVKGRGKDAREVKRTKLKLHDKPAALDKMAKVLAMYAPQQLQVGGRVEHHHEDDGPSSRQLARAILSVFRDAAIEGELPPIASMLEASASNPSPTSHSPTSTTADPDTDDGDDDASGAADMRDDVPENEWYSVGDIVPLQQRYHLLCESVYDDPPLCRWWVVSPRGTKLTCTVGLANARRAAEEIMRTGGHQLKITGDVNERS